MKISLSVLFIWIASSIFLLAQSSMQVKWPCDSISTTNPVITGLAAGEEEKLSDLIINNYKGLEKSQRLSPIASGGWGDESSFPENRYAQFAVKALPGKGLSISDFSVLIGSAGGSNMVIRVQYSIDTSFSGAVTVFNDAVPKNTTLTVSGKPNLELKTGESFYVRVSAYYVKGSTSGKYLCIKDMIINGASSTAGEPVIITNNINNILLTSASGGGNIISDGGSPITQRGICWGEMKDPTVSNSKTTDGSGTGSFVSSLSNLTAGTHYYVRAYATNSTGTYYGDTVSFYTLAANVKYNLSILSEGNGTVSLNPSGPSYTPGTAVTLTAAAAPGYSFVCWDGDISGKTNPATVTMNKNKTVIAKFVASKYMIAEKTPVGFAAAEGQGVSGTTGGAGGDTVYCPKGAWVSDFAISAKGPRTIIVDDTVTGGEIKNMKNISIIGRGDNAAMNGLYITNSNNIIVRNFTVYDSRDGIRITTTSSGYCHHIWIDHCSFTDDPAIDTSGNSHDGSLDITHRSSYITVSWCHFWNHRKTCLLGFSSSGGEGETEPNQLMVTYHHNWFDHSGSRHPRARWAPVHVFNNLYTANNIYGVGSTCGAKVVVERNYFDKVPRPVLISGYNDADGTLSNDPLGYVKSIENYSNTIPAADNSDSTFNFDPKKLYSYLADSAEVIAPVVKILAGAGKVNVLASNPVTVKQENMLIIPTTAELYQNYPNPFNPVTNIEFKVAQKGLASLKVYDLLGRNITTLFNETAIPGIKYSCRFDGSKLSSGLYLYKLESGSTSIARKLLLLK